MIPRIDFELIFSELLSYLRTYFPLYRDQEVPKTWDSSHGIARFRSQDRVQAGSGFGADISNPETSESLLSMRFYPSSLSVVRHLLSEDDDSEANLTSEVTELDQETSSRFGDLRI